jgi:hypothetical protein
MKELGWDSDSNKDNNEDKDYGPGGASGKVRGRNPNVVG